MFIHRDFSPQSFVERAKHTSSTSTNGSAHSPITDGVLIGYHVDTGEPLIIPSNEWLNHTLIVGQESSGYEYLKQWLLLQHAVRGGGVFSIDGNPSEEMTHALRQICAWAGREHDLLTINPEHPDASNTYNPILYGDPNDVASRCLSLIPFTESNAGADFYRHEANQFITTIVNIIQATGKAYNFRDLSSLLFSTTILAWFEEFAASAFLPNSDAWTRLSLLLRQYKTPLEDGTEHLDADKLKQQLGHIAARMYTFGSGTFGEVLNTYSPEVRLKEDLLANKIISISLPVSGKYERACQFGRLCVSDLWSALADIQARPEWLRPRIPVLGFLDGCGSYLASVRSLMFHHLAYAANVGLVFAFKSQASLESMGESARSEVLTNTRTKIFFDPHKNATDFLEYIDHDYGEIGDDECVVTCGENHTYRVRIPSPCFDREVNEYARTMKVHRRSQMSGLGLQERFAFPAVVPALSAPDANNLESGSDALRQMAADNTLTKVFFKPGENDTADVGR